jgi:ribosomal protein S27E
MKRPKKAKVVMLIYTTSLNSVTCPHCFTECKGFSENTVRMKCYHCEEEIILNWK